VAAFNTDFEITESWHALRGHQSSQLLDSVEYWRFDRSVSGSDDVYDEGTIGAGRLFRPPLNLPAIHVTHDEGGRVTSDSGFYWNDNIYATFSYAQFDRAGLYKPDDHHEWYLKDRIVYDGLVFKVVDIHILGQIDERDVVVSLEGTQVKPDEMVNDPQFAEYANWEAPNMDTRWP
jgi:hypothetical protein